MVFLFIHLSTPAGTGVFMNKNKHLTLDDRYTIQYSQEKVC